MTIKRGEYLTAGCTAFATIAGKTYHKSVFVLIGPKWHLLPVAFVQNWQIRIVYEMISHKRIAYAIKK